MPSDFDILVAGELNPDLILSGDVAPQFGQVEQLVDSAELGIGSSSAIFACAAARLGLRVAIIGWCGDDFFGKYLLNQLQERGVDTSNVKILPGDQTGLSVILNCGDDRAILTYVGLISALKAEDISDQLLQRARHLHVASYFLQTALQPGLPGLFTRAHSIGLTTSLDPNWDPSGQWRGFEELLRLTNVFLPNENEAIALSGADTVENALEILGQKSPVVAIKRGKQGGSAIQGAHTAHAQALPVSVVDTVGAGDNFDAGFLYGFLLGWSLEKSLRMATACGSLSTEAPGGVSGHPTLEEALKHVGHSG